MMLAAMVAGTPTVVRLGRAEDQVLSIRTLLVQAAWPARAPWRRWTS